MKKPNAYLYDIGNLLIADPPLYLYAELRMNALLRKNSSSFLSNLRVRFEAFADFWKALNQFHLTRIFLIISAILFCGSLGILFIEKGSNVFFKNYFDAIWYAVVSMTTTGYGDKYPLSVWGKIVGIFLMVSGVVTMSILTGNIASFLNDYDLPIYFDLNQNGIADIIQCKWPLDEYPNSKGGRYDEWNSMTTSSGYAGEPPSSGYIIRFLVPPKRSWIITADPYKTTGDPYPVAGQTSIYIKYFDAFTEDVNKTLDSRMPAYDAYDPYIIGPCRTDKMKFDTFKIASAPVACSGFLGVYRIDLKDVSTLGVYSLKNSYDGTILKDPSDNKWRLSGPTMREKDLEKFKQESSIHVWAVPINWRVWSHEMFHYYDHCNRQGADPDNLMGYGYVLRYRTLIVCNDSYTDTSPIQQWNFCRP